MYTGSAAKILRGTNADDEVFSSSGVTQLAPRPGCAPMVPAREAGVLVRGPPYFAAGSFCI